MPNAPRPAPPKIRRGEARRRELLAEAARILLRDGLEGASMDLIASEAGASKATLYRHFGDRHGLVVEAVQYLCADFLSDIQPNAPPGADLRTRLRAILLELIRVVLKPSHPDFFRLIVTGANLAPQIGEAWHTHGPGVWYRLMTDAFEDEIARGALPAGFDYQDFPEMLFDAVFGDMIIRTAVLREGATVRDPNTRYLDKLLDLVSQRIEAAVVDDVAEVQSEA
ncbi:MAG TPA: TetR/AcrR family transcriptional regulator [Paenirhodobacter sp.]